MRRLFENLILILAVMTAARIAQAQGAASVQALSPAENTSDNMVEATPDTRDTPLDPASLLPDLPALPEAKATLIGGTILKLDRVQDRITLQLFGGGKTMAWFDGRTQVFRDGQPALLASLKSGERVYLDTILFDGMEFARSIRLRTASNLGESQGIIVAYRENRNELVLRDMTAPQLLRLRLTNSTQIVKGDRASSSSELVPGTLVAIRFAADGERRDTVQQISILAEQDSIFTFVGTVQFLDLHAGLLVLSSSTNHKTYEIHLDPSIPVDMSLREGAEVSAIVRFDHNRYVARDLTVQASSQP